MLIEIVDVVREEIPSKNGKGTYGQLTVSYRSNGKIAEKKLISFSNPAVFKAIEKLTKGASVDVTTVKNDKGYWDWTAINEGGAAVATQSNAASTNTRVTGSNYETKEERAIRQRYIIRQSSISSAVDSLAVGAKSPLNPADVIAVAKKYEEYVFEQPNAEDLLDSLGLDDVPL
ncbi:MAG: hypothetical protein RLY40_984 [Pseudomonadota bacterium]|jgi:hypothetical protein